MSDFYSRMAATANRMLKRRGQTITVSHTTDGTYDPTTGQISGAVTTTQTVAGIMIEWDARQIDGTLIKVGDRRLLLSPLNTSGAALTAPVLGDTVTDAASVIYTLVAPLKTMAPAGTAILYDCNLRCG